MTIPELLVKGFVLYPTVTNTHKITYNCYPKHDSVSLAECLKPCYQFFIGIEERRLKADT